MSGHVGAGSAGNGSHELEDHDDGYDGPATLVVGGAEVAVAVRLGGVFWPVDGRYQWYGRVAADPEVARLVHGATPARLVTPAGTADAVLTDPDLWGRYRISGTSTPPFAVPHEIDEDDPAHAG